MTRSHIAPALLAAATMILSLPLATVSAASPLAPQDANVKTDNTWKPSEVITALRGAGHPNIVARYYTPSNDPNKILGRPGQYIGKANFRDRRTHESGFDVSSGGSVETFANKLDAARRFQYVKTIAESVAMFSEYDYLEGTVLLRVSSRLTPSQAKAYERAFRRAV